MRMPKTRWSIGAGIIAATASLALGLGALTATALTSRPAHERALTVIPPDPVTLRLASAPNQVATVQGASIANYAAVIQSRWGIGDYQQWNVDNYGVYFRFRNLKSGKCLNVEGASISNGAHIIQFTCNDASNEMWQPVLTADGYQYVGKYAGDKCLNVDGGVGADHRLILFTCSRSGAANDVWLPVWEHIRLS